MSSRNEAEFQGLIIGVKLLNSMLFYKNRSKKPEAVLVTTCCCRLTTRTLCYSIKILIYSILLQGLLLLRSQKLIYLPLYLVLIPYSCYTVSPLHIKEKKLFSILRFSIFVVKKVYIIHSLLNLNKYFQLCCFKIIFQSL